MNEKRRVGRPTKASQSIDEALKRAYAGELPRRPRNAIEREVMRKRPGRKKDPLSRTQAAVDYAKYMITEGMTVPDSYRKAADAFGLSPDTVRKALRKAQAGPLVELKPRTEGPFSQLLKPRIVPMVVDPSELDGLPWQTD